MAVSVLVATTLACWDVEVTVRIALVTTVTLGSGKMVSVGLKLNSGTVVVEAWAVEVIDCVEVTVSLSIGVEVVEMMTVGVTVVVCCGPTDREKSRS